jgi:hypothetical protein
MLRRVDIADLGPAWLETVDGSLYTDDGKPILGGVDYSTVDTDPKPPAWYVPPVVLAPAAESQDVRITPLAFLQRMTTQERIVIRRAAAANDALADYMLLLNSTLTVDLAHDTTRQGVQALEAAGLLGAGRAAQILDAPVQDWERPHA